MRDFVLGRLRIQMVVLFKEVNGTFSDADYKISKRAKPILFKENWQRIFEMNEIKEQVKDITRINFEIWYLHFCLPNSQHQFIFAYKSQIRELFVCERKKISTC